MIKSIIRPYLLNLTPYSSARDEYSGKEGVFLDANENPFGSVSGGKLNRYPDPYQWEIKNKLSSLKGAQPEQIFLGNGSDEAIDLLIKAVCEPHIDNIVILPPTYGMYKVCADIQQVKVKSAILNSEFKLDLEAVYAQADEHTKMIWICSPNNPSGNLIESFKIESLLEKYPNKLIIVDEAYIDFADQNSFISKLDKYENLVVLQTFSKAWGMAGLRVGMAYANSELITVLNKIKYPYNLNLLSQKMILKALENVNTKDKYVEKIKAERFKLFKNLIELSIVRHIFPSDSNQLLVKFKNAKEVFLYLLDQKIIVRDRTNVVLCEDCIRISVGTASENSKLIKALQNYK